MAIVGIIAQKLMRELRVSTQQWRARVTYLERERDDLISQVAAAQGVAAGGNSSGKPLRVEWNDPATGNTCFSDGEVRDPFGNQLIAPGVIRFDRQYPDDEAESS